MHEDLLKLPLKWKSPRTVFVDSMSDLFHEDVPFEFINRVFITMSEATQHTFLVLTKRPKRMLDFFEWLVTFPNHRAELEPQPNIWLG